MLTRVTAKPSEQDDLFSEEVTLLFPARPALEGRLLGSAVRQQEVPSAHTPCRLKPFTVRQVLGFEANLKSGETLKIIIAKTGASLDADLILLVPGATTAQDLREALERGEGRWVRPKPIDPAELSAQGMQQRLAGVTASWVDAFHLREGRPPTDGKPINPGCRRPQVGALHAALAHATRSTDPLRSSCRRAPVRPRPCSRSTRVSDLSACLSLPRRTRCANKSSPNSRVSASSKRNHASTLRRCSPLSHGLPTSRPPSAKLIRSSTAPKRRDRGASSRIEHGSAAAIKKLKAGWQDYRLGFDVRIVQPDLPRKAIGEEGLHLLAGVETYLLEARGMRLGDIGSD